MLFQIDCCHRLTWQTTAQEFNFTIGGSNPTAFMAEASDADSIGLGGRSYFSVVSSHEVQADEACY
jgi:hypothetical protein